jgi:hypothetical protein
MCSNAEEKSRKRQARRLKEKSCNGQAQSRIAEAKSSDRRARELHRLMKKASKRKEKSCVVEEKSFNGKA